MSQTTEILKSIPFSSRRAVQLAAVLAAYFVIAFVLGPFEGLSAQGQCAIATMVAAVIVWVTGALPLAVAAMLMTMIQPLSGAAPPGQGPDELRQSHSVFLFRNVLLYLRVHPHRLFRAGGAVDFPSGGRESGQAAALFHRGRYGAFSLHGRCSGGGDAGSRGA